MHNPKRKRKRSDEATLDHGIIMQMPLREFVQHVVSQLARPLAVKRREAYDAKWRKRMGRKPARLRIGHYWWEQEWGSRRARGAGDEYTRRYEQREQ